MAVNRLSPSSMANTIKRYNRLMSDLCYEYNTIGESYSDTEGWNLRDMVAECDYILSTFYEDGHSNESLRYEGADGRREWQSYVGRLTRFINHFAPYTEGMTCTTKHSSKYD